MHVRHEIVGAESVRHLLLLGADFEEVCSFINTFVLPAHTIVRNTRVCVGWISLLEQLLHQNVSLHQKRKLGCEAQSIATLQELCKLHARTACQQGTTTTTYLFMMRIVADVLYRWIPSINICTVCVADCHNRSVCVEVIITDATASFVIWRWELLLLQRIYLQTTFIFRLWK